MTAQAQERRLAVVGHSQGVALRLLAGQAQTADPLAVEDQTKTAGLRLLAGQAQTAGPLAVEDQTKTAGLRLLAGQAQTAGPLAVEDQTKTAGLKLLAGQAQTAGPLAVEDQTKTVGLRPPAGPLAQMLGEEQDLALAQVELFLAGEDRLQRSAVRVPNVEGVLAVREVPRLWLAPMGGNCALPRVH